MDLVQAAAILQKFSGRDLTAKLSNIETTVKGVTTTDCARILDQAGVTGEALAAAASLKHVAGEIHVTIHAIGILLCLPHILEMDEKVEYVSLGAGNTGREFDLETTHRIAEFKFIHWRGGPEPIRQNQLFKDFYLLAESQSPKRKYLYVLGVERPLRFLNGGRSLDSVLSHNVKLMNHLQITHGDKFKKVRDYYLLHQHLVTISDVSPWVSQLISETLEPEE